MIPVRSFIHSVALRAKLVDNDAACYESKVACVMSERGERAWGWLFLSSLTRSQIRDEII